MFRIIGGIGLALSVAILITCCYVAVKVDKAVGRVVVSATDAIDAAAKHTVEARTTLNELARAAAALAGHNVDGHDAEDVALVGRLKNLLKEVDQRITSVDVALKKVLVIVETFEDVADGPRVSSASDRLQALESRVATLSDQVQNTIDRLPPDGSLKVVVVEEVATRTIAAALEQIAPVGTFLDELNGVAEAAVMELRAVRSRVRRFIVTVAVTAVALLVWMGLGQLALLRGGLSRESRST